MDTSEHVDRNKLFIYILIAAAIIGLIILGVLWSRNRANQLAQTNTAPSTTQQEPSPVQEQPAAPTGSALDQHIASTQTTQGTGAQVVPAAGPTDTVLLLGSLSVAMFMGIRFLQARRHVRNAYRAYFTF